MKCPKCEVFVLIYGGVSGKDCEYVCKNGHKLWFDEELDKLKETNES